MIEIKIKYLDEATKLKRIQQGDWIDVYAYEDVILHQGESALVSLGFAMEFPAKYEAHLAPRSSTFKKWGILQTNSVAVIDNSYSGTNDIWKYPALAIRDTTIYEGDRICQFRIMKKQPEIEFIEVDELDSVDRGSFGSTGTR